jgi:hypothetical protein
VTKNGNIINHIGLVLDASGSMSPIKDSLIEVADNQIKYLAKRSKDNELDQETRISVWVFSSSNDIRCVVWDKDVLRLPSIAPYYYISGMTALLDATHKSIDDLREIPERYGDHSFLVYVLTDGEENASINQNPKMLASKISGLPNNWTLAALVPNTNGKYQAKLCGFPPGNIEIWDATSKTGVEEVGRRIRASTDHYMQSRSQGLRSTTDLFSTDPTTVNKDTIKAAGLKALAKSKYRLVPVPQDIEIRLFTQQCGFQYVVGQGFYELSKTETIQPQKVIAIVERGPKGRVYVGADARNMIGLPDEEVRVKPDFNPDFAVYVQSTSTNRKLKAGTKYLYLVS